MTRTLVFSGGGDYVDPWHPFAETSALVAAVLDGDGHEVAVVDRIEDLERALPGTDLLVVNAGGGPHPHPLDERLAAALEGLRAGIVVLHVAATLLPEHEDWERRVGGRWVRGVTMHPERGPLRLRARDRAVLAVGLDPLDTVDEAYSWLRVSDEAQVQYEHDHAGEHHPVVWTREGDRGRAAYSALGHDVAAYESASVRELLRRLARWAAAR